MDKVVLQRGQEGSAKIMIRLIKAKKTNEVYFEEYMYSFFKERLLLRALLACGIFINSLLFNRHAWL
ncbi:MAG: hypothetical protein EAZ67_02955 [Cytophagales bacterium]|nr:MAG: hypothetical protein EAZ67_02955 [Cytophagales bacterium]